MAVSPYLAMTAAEMQLAAQLPEKAAYMACHFSPYATGLSNIPDHLPPDTMLIVNDRTPMCGHDPEVIVQQLEEITAEFSCDSVLLDFERGGDPEAAVLAEKICATLTCPVGVSEHYAPKLNCPVFLSLPPLNQTLESYLAPWQNREIWLEAAPDAGIITVTEKGSQYASLSPSMPPEQCHIDTRLHCKYNVKTGQDAIRFHLYRDAEQLEKLLDAAKTLGVKRFIGLYQQRVCFQSKKLPVE